MGDKVQHMVDIGARDPYAAELATDFGNRQVGGHADTGHNVKIPETSVLGLAAREITPLPADAKALDEPAANKLKRAAGPGLILEVEGDALRATQQWTTAGAEQSEELSRRLVALGEELGHPLEVRIEGDRVTGVFWTPAVNGLTENDFILAAKVNNADFKDLLKKRKRRVFA
jgi:4a-hydroxytetrahydrobiopterin dehydratase